MAELPMKKRRASKACLSCRTRKVRCDYSEDGVACSNCKADGFECHTVERKKRRKNVNLVTREPHDSDNSVIHEIDQVSRMTPDVNRDIDLQDNSIADQLDVTNDFQSQPQISPTPNVANDPSVSRHTLLHSVPHYGFLMGISRNQDESENQSNQPTIEDVILQLGVDDDQNAPSQHSRLGEHEFKYLQMTGSLSLPDQSIMNELVDVYFRMFHPFFPIIEKTAFLHDFHQMNAGNLPGPSLLLLQAVLFIGSGVSRSTSFNLANLD